MWTKKLMEKIRTTSYWTFVRNIAYMGICIIVLFCLGAFFLYMSQNTSELETVQLLLKISMIAITVFIIWMVSYSALFYYTHDTTVQEVEKTDEKKKITPVQANMKNFNFCPKCNKLNEEGAEFCFNCYFVFEKNRD